MLDDIAIYAEEPISKHKYLIRLHNSEIMPEISAHVDIIKPYQIPSSGLIDTARIFTDSEYNSKQEPEEDEDIFSDAQCNLIKPIKLEIDPDSDEDEFWDAQNELEEHD